jgi:hypothetical protein
LLTKIQQKESDYLQADNVSTYPSTVLIFVEKHTQMNLVHYAAEFGCLRFFKSICRVAGIMRGMKLFCTVTRNGMNGFHFLAKNCDIEFLKYITKKIFKDHNRLSEP